MNYYYDIVVNWDENEALLFYDWNESDSVEVIKKIPLYRISSSLLQLLLGHFGRIDPNFLKEVEQKTTLRTKGVTNTIDYAFLVSDGKNALALECDASGKVLCLSRLLLDDALNVCEMIYGLEETEILFEAGEKREQRKVLREEERRKQLLRYEIDALEKSRNESKIKYFFLEWFGYTLPSSDEMVTKMKKDLQKPMDQKMLYIFDLMMLCHKKSGLSS